MNRKHYATDLTDAQWRRIAPLIPKPRPGGRPRSADMRSVLDAIFYVARTGCAWRMLPGRLPVVHRDKSISSMSQIRKAPSSLVV